MADAGTRRHHAEAVVRLLGPAQELVALDVALVLDVDVLVEGLGPAGDLGDHRVVDDQFDGDQRVDPGRVAAECPQGVAHSGQVDHAGHAGEVLHQHPFGGQCDLRGVLTPEPVALGVGAPGGHRLDVGGADGHAVLVAQQVLQHDLDRVGEPGHVEPVGQGVDPVDLVGGVTDGEVAAGTEGVGGDGRGGGLCHGPILAPPDR